MYQRKHQTHYLALLTAILLLMQSFAVWHDAEHAFHQAGVQCERFEAFGHVPSIDVIHNASVITSSRFVIAILSPVNVAVFNKEHDAYAIRAPPSSLS